MLAVQLAHAAAALGPASTRVSSTADDRVVQGVYDLLDHPD
ncbi:hypothetical protein [Geodermatophilus pulveris]|nr:hypothetical protein [Geodermatophilus pulveris]